MRGASNLTVTVQYTPKTGILAVLLRPVKDLMFPKKFDE